MHVSLFRKGGIMNFLKRFTGLFAALVMMSSAWGGVNLKNGNFYISYTDIVVPGGGKKLEITRHSRHFCRRPKPALSKTGQTLSNKCRTHSGGFFVPFWQPVSEE